VEHDVVFDYESGTVLKFTKAGRAAYVVNFDLGDILATLEHPSRRFRRLIRTFRFLQALEKFAGSLVARGGALPEDNQPSLDLLRAI
jgi:hypothetical protein